MREEGEAFLAGYARIPSNPKRGRRNRRRRFVESEFGKKKTPKRMSNPIDIEGTIHTARMQCMRGDREGALKKWEMDCAVSCSYQTVIDSISSVMGRMSPDQQLQAARTMNMYMEEAHAIQEQMVRESSAASGVYDMNAAVPVPNEPPRTTPDGLASIGQAFSDIGREVRSMETDDE